MAGWPVISLGTSSIEDSARISVSIEDHTRDSSSDQVMSFMRGKNARRNYGKTRAADASVAPHRFQIFLDQVKQIARTVEQTFCRDVNLDGRQYMLTNTRMPREAKL